MSLKEKFMSGGNKESGRKFNDFDENQKFHFKIGSILSANFSTLSLINNQNNSSESLLIS